MKKFRKHKVFGTFNIYAAAKKQSIFSGTNWQNKHITVKGVVCLFKHEKQLFHPVEIERPNPQYAALLQEQLGGGNGELKAAMQYMSQSFRIKDPKIKDLFLDIAAEHSWDCSCHGSRFDQDGRVLNNPATDDMKGPPAR